MNGYSASICALVSDSSISFTAPKRGVERVTLFKVHSKIFQIWNGSFQGTYGPLLGGPSRYVEIEE